MSIITGPIMVSTLLCGIGRSKISSSVNSDQSWSFNISTFYAGEIVEKDSDVV